MLELRKYLLDNSIVFERNISLKNKTWLKRGGETNLWIKPNSIEQLILIVKYLYKNKLHFEVIGNSSNCYFTENYNPTITISTIGVTDFNISDNSIFCGCGYNVVRLSKYAIRNGISGYEGFISLPGTIGGAVINNSGCFGSVMENVVKSVELITPDGDLIQLPSSALNYSHRYSDLKNKTIKGVLISVELDITSRTNPQILKEKSEFNKKLRKLNQENDYPNLGSIHSELVLWKSNRKLFQIIYNIIAKLLSITYPSKKKVLLKHLLFTMYGEPRIAKNVSDKNINCFIWKSKNVSDLDFFKYLKCIQKNSKKSAIEIEIKNEELF